MKTKQQKWSDEIDRIKIRLSTNRNSSGEELTEEKVEYNKKMLVILEKYLAFGKPKKKSKKQKVSEDSWFSDRVIDIYSIKFGYVKRSERKKTKGKSRKGMKKLKTKTFVKSVPARQGLLESFKSGKEGLSPKTHSFVIRHKSDTRHE